MTKLNHSRPLLRYIDNIRREINIDTRRSTSAPALCKEDEGIFSLNSSEEVAVIIFLDSIEKYLEAESAIFEALAKDITKKVKLVKRNNAEIDLKKTATIFLAHMFVAELKGRTGLTKFYKHIELEIKANNPFLWETINDIAMKEAVDKLSAFLTANGI